MANAVAKGAENASAQVTVKRAENVKLKDFQESDDIVMGSPTYFGQMSGKLKHIIGDSIQLHTQLTGKVGAAFTGSGGTASGAETTILSILQTMLIHGMIIQGNAEDQHYGVAAQGGRKPSELKACEELGARVALLVN
jgi:NAD(P)H dehydrogenase (quinone)